MRMLLPTVAMVSFGCTNDASFNAEPLGTGVANPRPLEATTQVDRILQAAVPEVDVLWVVSDGSTMYQDQDKLAENFPKFFDFFVGSGLDYHIGVVKTSRWGIMGKNVAGHLETVDGFRYVDPDTPAAASVLARMARVGTDGGAELAHDATYAALEKEKHAYNLGFLREGASVHVIVVSNMADISSDLRPEELAAYLNGLRQDPDAVSYHSIVYSGIDPTYVEVTHKVGGVIGVIQEEDWTGMFEELGMQAVGLEREYYLSQLPVPGTIEVSVVEGGATHTFDEGEDWAYDATRNSITFHTHVPEHTAEVVLEYEVLASHHDT